MSTTWVLDEDDALDVLSYLVTAARTQVDEAAEYGPMRLLTAARRLADAMAPRASAEFAVLDAAIGELPLLAVPRDDREGYTDRLDTVCRVLAAHLTARYASKGQGE